METYTQLGIAGATLGILFFIVKYFVKALDKKDDRLTEMGGQLIEIAKSNTESNLKLNEAIRINTEATNAMKESNDKLTKTVLKLFKK